MADYDAGDIDYDDDFEDEEEIEEDDDDDEETQGFAKGEEKEAEPGEPVSEGAELLEEMLITDNRSAEEQTSEALEASGGVSNLLKKLKRMRELKGDERQTSKFLGKYEKARLVAVRAKQIANLATPRIPLSRLRSRDSIKIARQELEEGVIPNKILRIGTVPGTYEIWELKDFLFIDRDW